MYFYTAETKIIVVKESIVTLLNFTVLFLKAAKCELYQPRPVRSNLVKAGVIFIFFKFPVRTSVIFRNSKILQDLSQGSEKVVSQGHEK
jgi:hypothetical protein